MTGPFTIRKLLTLLDRISPFAEAAAWDNVGLMVGEADSEVKGVLLALDLDQPLLKEARLKDCNTVVTHHPLIFHPLKSIRPDLPEGRLVAQALSEGINVISCHTNLDVLSGGVSDVLAERLGLVGLAPLQPVSVPGADAKSPGIGFGRIGRLAEKTSGEVFLAQLADLLGLATLRVAGVLPDQVEKIAVCGGSGSDLAEDALALGADLYVSSEIKHSTARFAELAGLCIVDVGHYHSEKLIVTRLAEFLRPMLEEGDYQGPLLTSEEQQSPFRDYLLKKSPN